MTTTPGSSSAADRVPGSVGRYRIVERIGRGAMGAVYAAVDEQTDRRVALKVLLGDLEDEPELRDRFLREARITGQLAHRNVVTLYDIGEADGRLYLVMELLAGLPLADYLHTPAGRPLEARIDLMVQICHGLHAAHARGVIHRDVKPSNLFVLADGTLKVLDFGVARLASSNLTASGLLIGTPEYMSPEQAQGRPVDARSDIFSAGAVFYYMLTGKSPFGSRDLRRMLDAILHGPPPALTDEHAPEPLRRIVLKALAKAPLERYQEFAVLADDLQRLRQRQDAATQRIVQAATDRYRLALEAIDDRRALANGLGLGDEMAAASAARADLSRRFWMFAAGSDGASHREQLDRASASDALEALQDLYNAELSALVALRDAHRAPTDSTPPAAVSWKERAAGWFRSKAKDS